MSFGGADFSPEGRVLRRSRLARAARFPMWTLMAAFAAGCVVHRSIPLRPLPPRTGDPVVDGNAALEVVPDRDHGLWEVRIAAAAIRAGQFDEAAAKLDRALARIGGVVGNPDEAARRARSLFTAEDTKNFIGEPYERSMAYYYRGLLYWRAGEVDNARACFRAAEFADSDAEGEEHRGDYVLFDFLDGFTSMRLETDGTDAMKRAAARASRELVSYRESDNVLFFVEFGAGPLKVAAGDHGEKLQFRRGPTRVKYATVTVNGQTMRFDPWDDLYFQATTRGGRVMDHVLGRKAVFKGGADAVGDVALAGAIIAAQNIYKPKEQPKAEPPRKEPPTKTPPPKASPPAPRRDFANAAEKKEADTAQKKAEKEASKAPELERNRDAERAAWILGTIAAVAKVTAAATLPKADTRTWDNLPQYLSFGTLNLPAGQHEAVVEFFDLSEQRIDALTRNPTIHVDDPARDTLVFLSELKR